jgi:hypothetical protein
LTWRPAVWCGTIHGGGSAHDGAKTTPLSIRGWWFMEAEDIMDTGSIGPKEVNGLPVKKKRTKVRVLL